MIHINIRKNQFFGIWFCLLILGSFWVSGIVVPAMAGEGQSAEMINSNSKAEDIFNQGMTRYREGTVAGFRGAIQKWEAGLRLWREANNPQQELITQNFLCSVYSNLGEYSQAINCYNQLLVLTQTLEDLQTQGTTLISIAKIYSQLGEYQKALDTLNQTFPLWQKTNFKTGEIATLNEMALIYFNLGEFQQALNYYNQALAGVKSLGNPTNVAAILNNIAQVESELNQFEIALKHNQQALGLWEEVINKFGDSTAINVQRGKGATLNNIGFIYANLNQLDSALETYNQALNLWQKIGDRTGEASTLNNIGFIYFQQNKLEQSLELYHQSLKIRQEIGDRPKEALSRYRVATVERKQGNFADAIAQMETALTIIEDLRTQINNQDLRSSFLASKQDYYQFYIDLLMQLNQQQPNQGWDGKALQISERAKARSLLDILAEAQGEVTSGVDPKLLTQKQTLKQKLSTLEAQRVKLLSQSHTDKQKQELNQEIENLLQEYSQVLDNIQVNNPHYAALAQPQPLTLTGIQKLLDDQTVLLEYSLGKERSYLWAVTPTSIKSYELPSEEIIKTAVKTFRDNLIFPSKRLRRSLYEETGKALTQIAFPLIPSLKNKRLLIVADGALQYVPFAALPEPETPGESEVIPLIINHELLTLPSASVLGIIRAENQNRKPSEKLLAVLADPVFAPTDERLKSVVFQGIKALPPDLERSARESGILFDRLPFTQEEANQILALVPEEYRLQEVGFNASRENATNPQLSQYRFVHFATHGLLNSENPQLSGLVFSLVNQNGESQNGFLRLYDIFNLNLPVELVVLSACETGLGQDIKGEGLVGLTRGFMYAGASRVVVSLWKVDDQSTAELMVKFYQGILEKGLSPVAALRQAQIQMQNNSEWIPPYYWSGFTLQGEWRGIQY
ncbi:CHAT domain-containing tetratricopeptide repeat protein [Planktothrix agardhii]|uniref:CHAT domain-containing tetratricopeptide repeat protein n=1 Tax=Planktothrix agardhii TaxID=1160 RepID=UPI0020A76316|nr:CHAT domain-containing tetratricopeptide repeat protein [Planktothrix agardhii]CAD5978582.1 Tetratricopeptide repeat protein 28 [Planktothrix agardhii]